MEVFLVEGSKSQSCTNHKKTVLSRRIILSFPNVMFQVIQKMILICYKEKKREFVVKKGEAGFQIRLSNNNNNNKNVCVTQAKIS